MKQTLKLKNEQTYPLVAKTFQKFGKIKQQGAYFISPQFLKNFNRFTNKLAHKFPDIEIDPQAPYTSLYNAIGNSPKRCLKQLPKLHMWGYSNAEIQQLVSFLVVNAKFINFLDDYSETSTENMPTFTMVAK